MRCITIVKRFAPLFFALWVVVDICLDIWQTAIYYNCAFTNGSYQNWAHVNQNITGYLETVSPVYFIVACIAWILPSILYSVGLLIAKRHAVEILGWSILPKYWYADCWTIKNVALLTLTLPMEFIFAFILLRFMLPYASLLSGWQAAKATPYDKHESIVIGISQGELANLELFENLFEAVPQFILAVMFTSNNYEFLWAYGEFVISVASAVFSCGILLHGIYTGCKACCHVEALANSEYTDLRENN